jgi:pimeloyl-ACP methyl ester carboxylesterase
MSKVIKSTPPVRRSSATQPEVVDPRWLIRAFTAMVALALVCGYVTLGLLFYMGSWQLALRPTHDSSGGTGLPADSVRFGVNAVGVPQLAGEWLPAAPGSARGTYAVLYLRGADGQLDRGDGTQIAALHDLGLNVLAFDYRGYGRSAAAPHPTQLRMQQDAESGWSYLTGVRKIAPGHIFVFGSGIGVSLAADLLQQHADAGALIGYNADPEVLQRAQRDPRAKLFPLKLIFHERFPLDALQRLHQPKLLYTVGVPDPARSAVYRTAADPKLTVEVATHNAQQEQAALARFLDDVAPAPVLMPLL